MPIPTAAAIAKSLNHLKEGRPLPASDISNIVRAFAHSSKPDRFLLETSESNEKLAEALLIFRRKIDKAVNEGDNLEDIARQLFHHYVVNTQGIILEGFGEDEFDIFKASIAYAKTIGVKVEGDKDNPVLVVDENIPCPRWEKSKIWSTAWSLRDVGPFINRARYGRPDVIPSSCFFFDENATGYTLENAMILADFAHLAYLNLNFVKNQLVQWDYTTFEWLEDADTDTQAFVAGNDDYLIVAFRGTSSGRDGLVDLNFFKTEAFGGRGRVHRGFNGAVDGVWEALLESVSRLSGGKKKIFFCGHSLGAALAQLAAHRFALKEFPVAHTYVFGSPRVGNRDFQAAYNELLQAKSFLHINNTDAVPKLAPRWIGFRHIGDVPRVFDHGHKVTNVEEELTTMEAADDVDFASLPPEQQQVIRNQVLAAEDALFAATSFLTTHPSDLEGGVYSSTGFETGMKDDHGMDQYLFKLGCAIVDKEWDKAKAVVGGEKISGR
jgi:pimeloyl-ACP methyl ester carboxylesterase